MNLDPLTVEAQFEVTKLRLFLKQNPEQSRQLAIKNFKDLLALVQAYKKLNKQYDSLQKEYSEVLDLLTGIYD
ncbi:MAG: hypothetical protein AAF298_23520 [Cyanobacteria bacterium P01_A01_bin.40]